MMKRFVGIWMVIVMALAFAGCGSQTDSKDGWTEDVRYMVHFGLNDKDTGEQIVSMEEANEIIQDICIKKGVGFTVYNTYGAYIEDGVPKGNDTLVFSLVLVTEELVEEIADEAMKTLNLASVFIIKDSVDYEFYGIGEVPAALNE